MNSGFSFCEVISDIIDRVVSMVLSLLDRSGDLGEIEVGDDDEDEDDGSLDIEVLTVRRTVAILLST